MEEKKSEELRRVWRDLPVTLTDAEWIEVAREKAARERELREFESNQKEEAAAAAAKAKEIKRSIDQLGARVESKSAIRPVECFERYVFGESRAKDLVEIVRVDTGEVVQRREPTQAETQRRLPGVGASALPADIAPDDPELLGEADAAAADLFEEDAEASASDDSEDDKLEDGELVDADPFGDTEHDAKSLPKAKAKKGKGKAKKGKR